MNRIRNTCVLLLKEDIGFRLKELSLFHTRGCRSGRKFRSYCLNRYSNNSIINNYNQAVSPNPVHIPPPTPPIQTSMSTRAALLNCQSARKKTAVLKDVITTGNYSFMGLVETWHSDVGDITIRSLTPPGYKSLDKPRVTDTIGGGLALVYKDSISAKLVSNSLLNGITSFEHLLVYLTGAQGPCLVLLVYRTGAINTNFYSDFTNILEVISQYSCPFYCIGDLNFHFERTGDHDTVNITNLLDSFALKQCVTGPTQCAGGTLDCVIARGDLPLPAITDVGLPGEFSDHSLIVFEPVTLTSASHSDTICIREWNKFSIDNFKHDLLNSPLNIENHDHTGRSPTEMANILNDTLQSLLDKQVPAKTRKAKKRVSSPWFDSECSAFKRRCRYKERVYRRLKTESTRLEWISECRAKQKFFRDKCFGFWSKRAQACQSDSRKLWRVVDSILARDSDKPDSSLSADALAAAFRNKVDDVRAATEGSPPPVFSHSCQSTFSEFTEVTVEQVSQLISNSNSKYSAIDPAPAWVIKDCISELAPFVTCMFNKSLLSSNYPDVYKIASVTPILKKPQLDPTESANYRPISNLQYFSKLLERIVLVQLLNYLNDNNLLPDCQSAYRKFHSTETAVSKVLSDIFLAADKGECTLLCMLDLSSAFDSVDVDILISRLQFTFGFGADILNWFQSYLTNRQQYICYNGSVSSTYNLTCGVPQGSVLGPILFLLYTSDVIQIIKQFGFLIHAYADDLQIYSSTNKSGKNDLKDKLSECITQVKTWMSSNRLKLNPSKTELIWLGSSRKYHDIFLDSLTLCGSEVKFSKVVKNLGIHIENDLSLNSHVNRLIRSSYGTLRELWQIRPSLTVDLAKTLASSFIHSRLDYCNSVLAGSTKTQLDKLNRILKATARFVFNLPRFAPVSESMVSNLHWLPFPQRIDYKLSLMFYKCRNSLAPSYLSIFNKPVESNSFRSRLRSSSSNVVMVPATRTNCFGRRSFSYTGPTQWNSLPMSLRSPFVTVSQFCSDLKTFLFTTI